MLAKKGKMKKPIVFLICGSTGSGKTTYSKELIKEHKAIYFSIDEYMKTLFWMDAPHPPTFDWAIEKVSRCETLIWQQTKAATALSYSVVLDLGFSETTQRDKFYKLLKSAAISYTIHFLDIPSSVRWERITKRNNAIDETSIFVSKESFDWMETYFQAPTEEELRKNGGIKLGV
jgi:predicted kinase